MIPGSFVGFARVGAAKGAKGVRELFRGSVRHKDMNTHAATQSLLPLEETASDSRTFLNASLWFVDSDGYRIVFRWHEPLYRVALTDKVHLRLVAVALRQSGLATQEEICRAFGHTVSTQARWERQYRKHAIDGLVSKKPSGRGRELDKSQESFVRRWFRAGCSNRQMAKRLGVDEATIRRTLKRLGLVRKPAAIPQMLPQIEARTSEVVSPEAIESAPAAVVERMVDASAEMVSPAAVAAVPSPEPCGQDALVSVEPPAVSSFTLDRDPRDRSGDRFLARQGLLEDAVPLFADAQCLPRAGVLLAVPLLVVTSEINAKLTQVLEPILAGVRRLVGDQRRMTVIFDRGGFSPKLFARLIASGFDVITYRKGKIKKLAAVQFVVQRRKIDGVWRQENYFKYAEEEFALDALVEYGAEEVPETTDRRNPQWLRLTRRLKEARAEVARLQSELGQEAVANEEATRPTMRGFKIAHAGLREQIQKGEVQIERLLEQRKKIPKRIPATDRMTLKTEKKLIADAIKMAAYQVETELLGMLQDHYARHPSTSPLGRSDRKTYHVVRRAVSRYLNLLTAMSPASSIHPAASAAGGNVAGLSAIRHRSAAKSPASMST
jgi:transposase